MKRLSPIIIIISSLLLIGHPGTSHADEYSASEDSGRRGILIGFGVQAGHIRFECADNSCSDEFNESGGLNLHVAYMLSRKLALSFDAWIMAHQSEFLGVDVTVAHSLVTIGPQFWLVPRIWVRGGLGWARASIEAGQFYDESESVLGIMGAIGWEVVAGRNFALDLQLRGGTGFYDGGDAINAGLGLGFTWF